MNFNFFGGSAETLVNTDSQDAASRNVHNKERVKEVTKDKISHWPEIQAKYEDIIDSVTLGVGEPGEVIVLKDGEKVLEVTVKVDELIMNFGIDAGGDPENVFISRDLGNDIDTKDDTEKDLKAEAETGDFAAINRLNTFKMLKDFKDSVEFARNKHANDFGSGIDSNY